MLFITILLYTNLNIDFVFVFVENFHQHYQNKIHYFGSAYKEYISSGCQIQLVHKKCGWSPNLRSNERHHDFCLDKFNIYHITVHLPDQAFLVYRYVPLFLSWVRIQTLTRIVRVRNVHCDYMAR